ncbi:MAG: EpsG family protein [Bacteroidaceae bacterium]|nr:EpsG family protein [Bacteroidaceae bacterium]
MPDFFWTEPSIPIVLVCLLAYVLFAVGFYRPYAMTPGNIKAKRGVSVPMWLFALFLVIFVCIDSDWFHYQNTVWDYDFTPNARNYGEPIYGFIIYLVSKNYLGFRLAVWGGALVVATATFKRLGLNPNYCLYLLICAFLLKFNYARASLAMALYFFGFSFLAKPWKRHPERSFLLFAFFLYLSYVFHTSCLILVALTIVILLPINKYTVTLLLLVLPFAGYYINNNIDMFFGQDFLVSDEYMQSKMQGYYAKQAEGANLYGQIANVIQYGAFYVAAFICIKKYFKHSKQMPVWVKRLVKLTISILLVSAIFIFVDMSSNVLFYRILFMTFIPLVILSVYLMERGLLTARAYKFILFWGIASNLYRLLYVLYIVDQGRYTI